jgi:thiol-disulfide isomerase/thioredoxin
LAPVYEQLADSLVHAKDKVVVAKVNADEHRELGQRFGVTGKNLYSPKKKKIVLTFPPNSFFNLVSLSQNCIPDPSQVTYNPTISFPTFPTF